MNNFYKDFCDLKFDRIYFINSIWKNDKMRGIFLSILCIFGVRHSIFSGIPQTWIHRYVTILIIALDSWHPDCQIRSFFQGKVCYHFIKMIHSCLHEMGLAKMTACLGKRSKGRVESLQSCSPYYLSLKWTEGRQPFNRNWLISLEISH